MTNDNVLAWAEGKTDAVPPPRQELSVAKTRIPWMAMLASGAAALAFAAFGMVTYDIARTRPRDETVAVRTTIPAAELVRPIPSAPPQPASPLPLNRETFQRFARTIEWADPPPRHVIRHHELPQRHHWHPRTLASSTGMPVVSRGYTGGCPQSICETAAVEVTR